MIKIIKTIGLMGMLLALAIVFALPNRALATWPGVNGKIAFVRLMPSSYEIFTANPNGTAVTQITNNANIDFTPSFSPNGSKIVFERFTTNYDIWTMNTDGSGQTNLTNNAATDYQASFSPNGSKIVFVSNRDTANYDIYTMNADGSGVARITNLPIGGDHYAWPVFSADSNSIFFTSNHDGDQEIYKININSTGLTRLTTSPGEDHTTQGSLSPDGTKLLFFSSRSNANIWRMNTDGTNLTQITNDPPPISNYYPAWSPDGSKITFTKLSGTNFIYTANANGSNQARLTSTTETEFASAWQPTTTPAPTPAPTPTPTPGVPNTTTSQIKKTNHLPIVLAAVSVLGLTLFGAYRVYKERK